MQVVHRNILFNENLSCSDYDVEYIRMETCQSCFGHNARKIKKRVSTQYLEKKEKKKVSQFKENSGITFNCLAYQRHTAVTGLNK